MQARPSWLVVLLCLAGCATAPAPAPAPVDPAPPAAYELLRVVEVEGRQGVATDGVRYYVSGSTALYVYSKAGELLMENLSPFEGFASPANHIGDIGVHDGEIYAGVEWFEDGKSSNIQIAVYDAATLRYVRSIGWDPASGQKEVSAVAVDPARGLLWLTDWTDGSHLYRYDLRSGEYAGKVRLDPAPPHQQGIAVLGGHFYLTADDGDADHDEPDNLWRAVADREAGEAGVSHEMAFGSFRRTGEIEGLDFDEESGEMLVLSNRGARIVLGMPRGFYPGYDREIHEIYVYARRTGAD